MALNSAGFDGSIVESDWAGLSNNGGSRYSVGSTGDFKVTPRSAATLTCDVAAGVAYGGGVKVTNTAALTVTHATAPATGTRWDAVVIRRNWSGTGGTASVVVITGTATRTIPARNNTPGVLDDQVLALVPINAGQSIPGTPVDCRWLASKVITCGDLLAIPEPVEGMEAVVLSGTNAPSTRWRYELDPTGNPGWKRDTTQIASQPLTVLTGTAVSVAPTGWTSNAMVQEAMVSSNTVNVYVETRTSTDVPITATTGNITDTLICTLDAALRPDRAVNIRFQYKTAAGGLYFGDGVIDVTGNVTIQSAQPNTGEIAAQGVGIYSLRFNATYLVKD